MILYLFFSVSLVFFSFSFFFLFFFHCVFINLFIRGSAASGHIRTRKLLNYLKSKKKKKNLLNRTNHFARIQGVHSVVRRRNGASDYLVHCSLSPVHLVVVRFWGRRLWYGSWVPPPHLASGQNVVSVSRQPPPVEPRRKWNAAASWLIFMVVCLKKKKLEKKSEYFNFIFYWTVPTITLIIMYWRIKHRQAISNYVYIIQFHTIKMFTGFVIRDARWR